MDVNVLRSPAAGTIIAALGGVAGLPLACWRMENLHSEPPDIPAG
jgi:hypothetical protein